MRSMSAEMKEKYFGMTTVEALEASPAGVAVKVKAELHNLTVDHNARMCKHTKLQEEVMQKQAELDEILAASFFQRMFNKKKFEERKSSLVAEIAQLKKECDAIMQGSSNYFNELIRLKNELAPFLKEISVDSLTMSEIKSGYDERHQEIMASRLSSVAETPVTPAQSKKNNPPRIEQNSKENKPLSARERFERRMWKHTQLAGKAEVYGEAIENQPE